MDKSQSPRWCGIRGECYVLVQLILMAVVVLGPRTASGLPPWPASAVRLSLYAGGTLMLAGGCLLLASVLKFGANLTPLPYPKPGATFVQSGPYRFVRHPMYTAVILLTYGWAVAVRGWLTLVYATVLLVFLDIKAAREERWLVDRYPEYPAYRRRVHKFVPFIY